MKFENEGLIKGKITSTKEVGNMVILNVFTKVGNYANFPTVLFFGDVAEKAKVFRKNDIVVIKGAIESKRDIIEEDGRTKKKYSQAFVATDIEEAKSLVDDEVNSHRYENQIKISGSVNYVSKVPGNDNLALVSVYTLKGKHPNFILLSLYGREAAEALEKYEKGDNICALTTMQTSYVKKDEITRKRENIVIKEIKKIEE